MLLRSAPLDRLSGELCDAVLQRRGSGLLLRELAHGNVPLTPLDRAERGFRLHPLVADALLAELRRTDMAWERQRTGARAPGTSGAATPGTRSTMRSPPATRRTQRR